MFRFANILLEDTIVPNSRAHVLKFKLRDQNGDVILVRHTGEMPSNLSEVKKVVAVGYIKNGVFESSKLLIKCPSKYEADRKVASN